MKRVVWYFLLISQLAGCASTSLLGVSEETRREVTFSLKAKTAKSIAVVGSFNNWKQKSLPMRQTEKGKWSTTIHLLPGAYQYMFVVDGRKWTADPNAQHSVNDGFGRKNSLLIIE